MIIPFDNSWVVNGSDIEDISTRSDQAGPFVSRRDFINDDVDDETIDNASEWMDGEDSQEIESDDSDQIHVPFSGAQYMRSNALGKRSIDGPSVDQYER